MTPTTLVRHVRQSMPVAVFQTTEQQLQLSSETHPHLQQLLGCSGSGPVGGGSTVRPHELLSAFDGEQVNGTWTLTVVDDRSDRTAALTGWSLQLSL